MKKNIFLIIGVMTANLIFPNISDNRVKLAELGEIQECEQKNERARSCEESDEFEDFFGVDTEDENDSQPRQQKQKPSRMQLAMIRLGVAVALKLESCYHCMRSLYAYLKSWVVRENRKA